MDLRTLNERLALALGTNPYGEGVFRWEHSDDLFWPEFATGRMISKPITVPIIGAGIYCPDCGGTGKIWHIEDDSDEGEYERCWHCGATGIVHEVTEYSHPVPEYVKMPMCPELDHQWVMTCWFAPEKLEHWQARFPGAPYPSRGYRIRTNASLPSYPGGPREPNLEETERFIGLLRHQRAESHAEVVNGMLAEDDKRRADNKKEIMDEVKDDFPAFMNNEVGKRGGYVSLPYTKKDRVQ